MPDGPVVVLGAGGHAKVVLEVLREAGETVVGLTDADPAPRAVLGAPVLGTDAALPDVLARGCRRAFVALGDNAVRRRVAEQAMALGFELASAISPRAVVSPSARLGRGVAVMAGAVINADAEIGDLAIVNTGAVVEHDCRLGAAAHLGPRAALAGGVVVGEGAFLGVGASVIPGVTIGAAAVVGAGACVVRDVPEGARIAGVPARALLARREAP